MAGFVMNSTASNKQRMMCSDFSCVMLPIVLSKIFLPQFLVFERTVLSATPNTVS